MTPKPLTSLQSRFIDEYIKSLDATKSALKAGYAKDSATERAHDLLKNPRVISELHNRLNALSNSLCVTKSFIVQKLLLILDSATKEEPILDKNGSNTGLTKLKDPAVALRALDALAKCYIGDSPQNPDPDGVRVMFIENLDDSKI